MFVPFITPLSQRLWRRKGGGAKGSGGGAKSGGGDEDGGGSGGGSSSGSSSGKAKGTQSSVPISGATNGKRSAVSYGPGGGKVTTIPQGQPFAGRSSGGGTRNQVYGSP